MNGSAIVTLALSFTALAVAVVIYWRARRTWADTRRLLVTGDSTTTELRAAARRVLRAWDDDEYALLRVEAELLRAAVEASTEVEVGMLGEAR